MLAHGRTRSFAQAQNTSPLMRSAPATNALALALSLLAALGLAIGLYAPTCAAQAVVNMNLLPGVIPFFTCT